MLTVPIPHAITGTLGVAFLDTSKEAERTGQVAFQIHAGPPMTARYRIVKLVHNPKLELTGLKAEQLLNDLKPPDKQ